jgi:uncharacterized membrane protein YvbJ
MTIFITKSHQIASDYMEALFCSKCDEKIVDANLPCKFCGYLSKKSEESSPSQVLTAKPRSSKLLILVVCVVVIAIVIFFVMR